MALHEIILNPKGNGSGASSGGLVGTWNSSTNTPTLSNTDTGKLGIMYQVSVGGSVDFGAGAITFEAKDIVINNGTTWEKIGADASSTFVQDPTTKAIKVAEEVGTTGNARGVNAIDLQVYRASASQVASGNGAIQLGSYSTASGTDSTALGRAATSTGTESIAIGGNSIATKSLSLGYKSYAYLNYQTAIGSENVAGSYGSSQYSIVTMRKKTLDATPKVMSIGTDITQTNAVLPSGKSWRFVIELVAKNTSNGDTFAATYVGAIKRVGSTTSLIGSVTERDKVNDTGASTWSVAVTANDTNESLDITVTGQASTTINWCAVVHLTEVA